jgi:hypothetical protein
MKAQSTQPRQPMAKMPLMKAKPFQPAKKIADVQSFKSKKSSQLDAIKKYKPVYKSGMMANGQSRDYSKSPKGTISSLD